MNNVVVLKEHLFPEVRQPDPATGIEGGHRRGSHTLPDSLHLVLVCIDTYLYNTMYIQSVFVELDYVNVC